MESLTIYVLSDSTGETAELNAKAALAQFKTINYTIKKFSHIRSRGVLEELMSKITKNDLLFFSLISPSLRNTLVEYLDENKIYYVDVLTQSINIIEEITGVKAATNPGALRELDENYFKRVEAIEFAVQYDDGKNPRGILKSDICLIGVSRTSKTPLSMYLANKNFKVANVPLVPETSLPDELFQVPSSKIIGLTNSPDNLNKIRSERARSLGLNTSTYTDLERILEETEYAHGIMKKIGCPIIDVSDKAIEETADIIIDYIKRTNNLL